MQRHPVLSRPLRLHWAGWETDTYRLQRAGWRLSADQIVERDTLQIAMDHPDLKMQGISRVLGFDYHRIGASPDGNYAMPDLVVQHMAARLEYRVMGGFVERPESRFAAIDAAPQWITNDTVLSLNDLAHFAPAAPRQQIILPAADRSVQDLLDEIVSRQQGARLERIREAVSNERYEPVERLAQIVQLRRAA